MNIYSADEAWCESKERYVKAEVAERLYKALSNAREELKAWRASFTSYADSEEVAVQIDDALDFADNN